MPNIKVIIGGIIAAALAIFISKRVSAEQQFDPWQYDTDSDGIISMSEYLAALHDFTLEKITQEQLDAVKLLWEGEPEPEPEPVFYMPPTMDVVISGDGEIAGLYWNCAFSVLITNNGEVAGTQLLAWTDFAENNRSYSITLEPGETYLWTLSQWVNFRTVTSVTMYLQGNWAENNESTGVAQLV